MASYDQLNGVIKVVNNLNSWSSFMCQKPLLAPSFEKILLCPNLARLSSTENIEWTSLLTPGVSCTRSTQTRTEDDPFGLRTGTIPEHQLVGSVW